MRMKQSIMSGIKMCHNAFEKQYMERHARTNKAQFLKTIAIDF